MTRLSILGGLLAGVVSASLFACYVATADSESDDRCYAERQLMQLQDAERQLLREEDRLKQDVDELKREIAVRLDRVDTAQRRLDRINHDLITIRMKLMP